MKKQKSIFMDSEGDAWFDRNTIASNDPKKKIEDDPLLKELAGFDLKFNNVLEIGAGNGWRLSAFLGQANSLYAIEPSLKAIKEGTERYPAINFFKSTADSIPLEDNSIDLIIYGFCLYLCDRDDLFKIVCEADRVLADDGYIFIHDFYSEKPVINEYRHMSGINSYKMDYSKLFIGNPLYSLDKIKKVNDIECIWILNKNRSEAYQNDCSI